MHSETNTNSTAVLSSYQQAVESVAFISKSVNFTPRIGVVLGSGLGDFCDSLTDKIIIPYRDIPHFKQTAVIGHEGNLVFGTVNGVHIVCMQGRFHFYEGHSMSDIVFPIKVLKLLKIEVLILTNAAGGLNDSFQSGDLVLIRDHINLFGVNPLIGLNEPEFGVRFPDMSVTYTPDLIEIAKTVMKSLHLDVKTGVYAGMTGPSYETPMEVQMLRVMRADLVGASTVYEAITASHMDIQVLGISCVTNMGTGLSKTQITHQEVIDVSNKIKKTFQELISTLIPRIIKQ